MMTAQKMTRPTIVLLFRLFVAEGTFSEPLPSKGMKDTLYRSIAWQR
jgi:hypothetical protein